MNVTSSRDSELLLAAVRVAIGTASADELRTQAREDVDWAHLVQTALQHGVMPLLYRGLTSVDRLPVPPRVFASLREHFRDNARRNLLLTGALLDLVTRLDAKSILAMPIKGPLLAISLYGDQALRQFADLDILVSKNDVVPAKEQLAGLGYRFRAADETSVVATCGEPGSQVTIDLQWALGDTRYRFPMDQELWSRLETVFLAGRRILQPAPADLLLILCAHPAKHSWSRLGWISDIAAFLRAHGGRLDWPGTFERARALGGERLLLIGLRLAGDLLRAPVPKEALERSRADPVARALAQDLGSRLFVEAGEPRRLNGSYGFVEAALLYMRSRERFADKLAHARHLMSMLLGWCSLTPNEQDRAVIALPSSLAWLYYVVRPFRLAGKYGLLLLYRGVQMTLVWR